MCLQQKPRLLEASNRRWSTPYEMIRVLTGDSISPSLTAIIKGSVCQISTSYQLLRTTFVETSIDLGECISLALWEPKWSRTWEPWDIINTSSCIEERLERRYHAGFEKNPMWVTYQSMVSRLPTLCYLHSKSFGAKFRKTLENKPDKWAHLHSNRIRKFSVLMQPRNETVLATRYGMSESIDGNKFGFLAGGDGATILLAWEDCWGS